VPGEPSAGGLPGSSAWAHPPPCAGEQARGEKHLQRVASYRGHVRGALPVRPRPAHGHRQGAQPGGAARPNRSGPGAGLGGGAPGGECPVAAGAGPPAASNQLHAAGPGLRRRPGPGGRCLVRPGGSVPVTARRHRRGDRRARPDQAQLAQLVGASRETVNKALGEFGSRGWIEILERRADWFCATRPRYAGGHDATSPSRTRHDQRARPTAPAPAGGHRLSNSSPDGS
jgi:Crp-like helix-turn-helix protein